MKTTIFHAQIISNLLLVINISTLAFLATATTSANATNDIAKNDSATAKLPIRGRHLIGSILLRAANLNSINYATTNREEQHQEEQEQDEEELVAVDSVAVEQSQLLVPTDSGEDPLETTVTTTTQADEDDEQAPPTVDVAVDSNNVSAIIKSSSSSSSPPPQTTPPGKQRNQMTCEQAYTQCALRKACAPALKAYNDHCHELISNQTSDCSAKCLDAMIALRSSEEGHDLDHCDCQSNEYCLASKQRSQLCREQVDRALDPHTVVSCSTASWICLSDQSCAPALGFYYRNCRSLLTQRHCSARCNNSLSVLYRQPKALKLISCKCDGSEDFPCERLKAYTEQLCLNKHSASPGILTGSGGGGGTDEDELTSEEENSNMTNNPENFVLGVPIVADSAGAEDESDGDYDNKDNAAAAGSATEESSRYNGIQLVEDNWIPLISGRYFTNLHQQQQQQQLEGAQQSKQQQQQQRHRHKEIHLSNQQQQARRIQRNMRQQRSRMANETTTHQQHPATRTGKRSRFGRIFMFAASTSSASSTLLHNINHWPFAWILLSCMWSLILVTNQRNCRYCC